MLTHPPAAEVHVQHTCATQTNLVVFRPRQPLAAGCLSGGSGLGQQAAALLSVQHHSIPSVLRCRGSGGGGLPVFFATMHVDVDDA